MAHAETETATITLLLTDVEGSTALWERDPSSMSQAMRRHDEIAHEVVAECGGRIVKGRGEGDSLFCAFGRATDALRAALKLQIALEGECWPTSVPIRARVAVHTGEAELRGEDYYGTAVNRCARLRAIGHGGQVLVSHATEQIARDALPEGASLLDLGLHRLRDLSRPEWVFCLKHPSLDSDFPPLRSLDAQPNNLPVQLTSFVGRKDEVAQGLRLLRESRLLTLTGPGGTGKTRLALQIAAEASEVFESGIWFVNLVPLQDPERVAMQVASDLGVRHFGDEGIERAIAQHVGDGRLLLVLDNCERVLSGVRALADALLRSAAGLKVLATSRAPIGMEGEQLYPVSPMQVPKAESSAASRLIGSDAGSLFLERARAANPKFALNSKNAADVAAICRAVDGMPLAIELAAARIGVLSPKQILERLHDRFGLLVKPRGEKSDRHRTLRATIDWSYDLLGERERRLFATLAVFRGGWTLEAAEAVCSDEGLNRADVLDTLQSLADHSIVAGEPDESGATRYRMLETLREYALELASGRDDWTELRERHFDWFCDLVRQAEPRLGGPEQKVWFDRLEADLENIRAAVDWALSEDARAEDALRLTSMLHNFWVVRGYHSEALSRLTNALSLATKADPKLRAHCLNLSGVLAMMAGRLKEAVPLLERSLKIRRRIDDRVGQAATINNLGMVQQALERPDEALAAFEESVRLLRGMSNPTALSYALLNVGGLYCELGRFADAKSALEESLSIARELEDQSGICYGACNLATAEMALGEGPSAALLLSESLTAGLDCRDLKGLHETFLTAAEVLIEKGKPGPASFAYGASEALLKTLESEPTPLLRSRSERLEKELADPGIAEDARRSRELGLSSTVEDAVSLAIEQLDHLTR